MPVSQYRSGDVVKRHVEVPVRLVGCLLVGAIVLAPYLGFIVDPGVGLGVIVVALGATTLITGEAIRLAPSSGRRKLRVLQAINAGLALLCFVALLARLAS